MKKNGAIVLEQLSVKQRGQTVLTIEELIIRTGETVCIHGDNGSGKTSLLRALTGFSPDCSGQLYVLGQNLLNTSNAILEKNRADNIGFIFQHYRLVPYLSAFDNIMLPCHFSEQRKQKAITRANTAHEDAFRLIRKLRLQDPSRLSKNASAYSAGQQQRFAIARALIGSPTLVLADEPGSAMDCKSKEAVYDLLLKECDETGATLICTSHDQLCPKGFDRYLNMEALNTTKEPEVRW